MNEIQSQVILISPNPATPGLYICTLSARSHMRMVPSSLAEMKTSLKGCVAKPQIPPWVCPLIMVLEAAFFSPTSMISPSLVPTRILPWSQSTSIKGLGLIILSTGRQTERPVASTITAAVHNHTLMTKWWHERTKQMDKLQSAVSDETAGWLCHAERFWLENDERSKEKKKKNELKEE